MSKDKEKKTTNEKPVSLSPLSLKEALEALLKIKPKSEEKKKENEQEQKKSGE